MYFTAFLQFISGFILTFRVRPLNEKETNRGEDSVITFPGQGQMMVSNTKPSNAIPRHIAGILSSQYTYSYNQSVKIAIY